VSQDWFRESFVTQKKPMRWIQMVN